MVVGLVRVLELLKGIEGELLEESLDEVLVRIVVLSSVGILSFMVVILGVMVV